MKFQITASVLALLAALDNASAFAPPTTVTTAASLRISPQQPQLRSTTTHSTSTSSRLHMSAAQDEVAKLRAAAAAAREDAARLTKELGKDEPESAAKVAVSTKSKDEVASAIQAIDFASSASTQIAALDGLRAEGAISVFKSATVEAGSGDLRNYPVSLSMLEQRSGLTALTLGIGKEEVSLDDFKYATLYVTGGCSVAGVAALVFLPENVGATVCYMAALIPILFLGVGSTAPAAIANVIASVKGSNDGDVPKLDRVTRHEAAHFLCGYLCGLPIADYSVAANENVPRVEFHSTQEGPLTAQAELTDDQVNALTVVAMSGSVAEAMEFGSADGANADLMELENVFRSSKQFLGSEKSQDLTRWGALTAHRLLTTNKAKLDQLVDAFSKQKSVAECMVVLES